MVAALASGRPGLASLLLSLSAWALFFAHEPALVLLGRRGPRARAEAGSRAWGRLAMVGGAAVALGVAGLLVASPAVRWSMLVPVALGATFALFVALGRERSGLGEVLAAEALAGVALPIAMSSGVSPLDAGRAGMVWALGLPAVVLPVRGIGARRRSHDSAAAKLLPALGALVAAVGLLGRLLVPFDLIALAPLLLTSVWLAAVPPNPRQLRRVGWSLVGSTLLTAGFLVFAARR
jgi:hypothetical protein